MLTEIKLTGSVPAAQLKEIAKSLADSLSDSADLSPEFDPASGTEDQTGIRQQNEELFSVGIPLVLGRLSDEQIRKAADACERYGNGTVRFPSGSLLLFPDIQKDKVSNLLEGLQTVGLNLNVPALLRGVSACAEGKAAARE